MAAVVQIIYKVRFFLDGKVFLETFRIITQKLPVAEFYFSKVTCLQTVNLLKYDPAADISFIDFPKSFKKAIQQKTFEYHFLKVTLKCRLNRKKTYERLLWKQKIRNKKKKKKK